MSTHATMQASASTTPVYRLKSLLDFQQVPYDRIDECLINLGTWLRAARIAGTATEVRDARGGASGFNLETGELVWADDGVISTSTKAQGDAGKLIVVGGRQFNTQALLDLQHDAARYRWLRDKADGMAGVAAPMVASLDEAGRVSTLLDGDDLDAAVDMAMAARAEKRQRKTKCVGTNK